MYPDQFLEKRMQAKPPVQHSFNSQVPDNLVDFSSTDYIGIRRNGILFNPSSSGSERPTLSTRKIAALESRLTDIHLSSGALLFDSGYLARLSVLGTVPGRGDTIIYDELVPPPARDGIRLSRAEAYPFLHNDLDNLTYRLVRKKGNSFVVTQSCYPERGETLALAAIVKICERYGAHLILDETYSIGIRGPDGCGLAQELDLEKRIFARIISYSKITGVSGAVVLGSKKLKDFLSLYATPYLYSSGCAGKALLPIEMIYAYLKEADVQRIRVRDLCRRFRETSLPFSRPQGEDPALGLMIAGHNSSRKLSRQLKEAGFALPGSILLSRGSETYLQAFQFHSYNTPGELDRLLETIRRANLPAA